MADFDLEALLAPLQDDAPCGADLEYDPAFLALLSAATGRPEQQYGDTVIPAEEPDWAAVHEQALALAGRTRDLRVAVWLARSGARQQGLRAGVDGLRLIAGLLERHWAHVHPQLDASDGNDPTMRLNALLPLASDVAGLADLRAASLTGQRGGPRVRDIELAFGNAEPINGESVPAPQALADGLGNFATGNPWLPEQLQAGLGAVLAAESTIDQHLGAGQAPDFAPLTRLLKSLAALGQQLQGGAPAPAAEGGTEPATATPPRSHAAAQPGVINSRDDAVRALQRVCDWIEQHEPSNPAPLLIRRAQRLMSKSFMDIMRDLVPEGVQEIEKLAGVQHE